MTTLDTLTDQQIKRRQDEAGAAGDLKMVAICERALNGAYRSRRECVRVILENEAQS